MIKEEEEEGEGKQSTERRLNSNALSDPSSRGLSTDTDFGISINRCRHTDVSVPGQSVCGVCACACLVVSYVM